MRKLNKQVRRFGPVIKRYIASGYVQKIAIPPEEDPSSLAGRVRIAINDIWASDEIQKEIGLGDLDLPVERPPVRVALDQNVIEIGTGYHSEYYRPLTESATPSGREHTVLRAWQTLRNNNAFPGPIVFPGLLPSAARSWNDSGPSQPVYENEEGMWVMP